MLKRGTRMNNESKKDGHRFRRPPLYRRLVVVSLFIRVHLVPVRKCFQGIISDDMATPSSSSVD
jgi:hypothetical protein